MATKLSEVTNADLGQWVAGATTYNPIEFNVEVVKKAISLGFELDEEQWNENVPLFLSGEYTYEMVEDLGYVCDEALAWMNSQLPDWYFLDFGDDGLMLFKDC